VAHRMIAIRARRKIELQHLQRKKVLLVQEHMCNLNNNLPSDLQMFKNRVYDVGTNMHHLGITSLRTIK